MKLKDLKDVLTFRSFRPEPDDSSAPWRKRFPREKTLLLTISRRRVSWMCLDRRGEFTDAGSMEGELKEVLATVGSDLRAHTDNGWCAISLNHRFVLTLEVNLSRRAGLEQQLRTNPKAANSTLRYYLRRQVEDKLRFAYRLDPAHYGNFTALYFFLTQPSLGTRKELTPSATKLADDTIRYCLKQEHDPRPALTAAAALTDILELMFTDFRTGSSRFTIAQMRQKLELLDTCIARYSVISQQWDLTKNWDMLSPMRLVECEERLAFIRKMRDTALNTITLLEADSKKTQSAN